MTSPIGNHETSGPAIAVSTPSFCISATVELANYVVEITIEHGSR